MKKVGYQIAERSGDDKRIGVERRIEEVHEEHKELINKVNKKYEVCLCVCPAFCVSVSISIHWYVLVFLSLLLRVCPYSITYVQYIRSILYQLCVVVILSNARIYPSSVNRSIFSP